MPLSTSELLALLDAPEARNRRVAINWLGRTQHMLPPEQVARLFEDPDDEVRLAVLDYLEINLPPGHHEIALKGLHDPALKVRQHALEYLTRFPTKRAAASLESLIHSEQGRTRDLAIRALGQCDDGRASQVLLEVALDPNDTERFVASHVIGDLSDQSITERLMENLNADDDAMINITVNALRKVRDERVIEPLLRYIAAKPVRRVIDAIRILDNFRDSRICDGLLALVENNQLDEWARGFALHVLGNYPEARVIDVFKKLLEHGRHHDRHAVGYALTVIGGSEAVDCLMAVCDKETDASVLMQYSYAFAVLGDKRAVPVVQAMLNRVDGHERNGIQSNLKLLMLQPDKSSS